MAQEKRRFGRVVVRALGFIAAMVAVAALVGWLRFRARRDHVYSAPVASAIAPTDPATLARGEHLAHTLGGCAECHGADFGGRLLSDDAAVRLVAPNLTPGVGSVVRGFSDADWLRAVVDGTDKDGHSLVVMPSKELRRLSADDLRAVVAYLKTLPAVDRNLGRPEVRPIGSIMIGLTGAKFFSAEGFDHTPPEGDAPERGPTRAYGVYLSNMCRGCHGPALRGGIVVQPGAPPSGNISPVAMASWKYEEFERALREGKRRDGSNLDAAMPWPATRGLTDDELRALWLGLRQE